MAGEWIKMRVDLAEDPAVIEIADRLDVREETIVGYCHKFWSWVSRQCNGPSVTGVTLSSLGRVLRLPGFPEMLVEVGWLEYDESGGKPVITIPNYDRHLSQTAKSRALTNSRVAENRKRKCNAPSVTKALPEKRREEKNINTPQTPQGGPSVQEFFDRWNSFAEKKKLSRALKLTKKRRDKIRSRLCDPGWWEAFGEAVKRLPIPGDGWQPDLDWIVRSPDNAYKLAEGAFQWRDGRTGAQEGHGRGDAMRREEQARETIRMRLVKSGIRDEAELDRRITEELSRRNGSHAT